MNQFNPEGVVSGRSARALLPVYVPAEECVVAWVTEYKKAHAGACPSTTWIANVTNVPRSTCHKIVKRRKLC